MKTTMIKCDNPLCDSVGYPEWQNGTEYGAPYGWWSVAAECVGPGPLVNTEVCSLSCLQAAIENRVESDQREEYDEMERQADEFKALVLEQICPRCLVTSGDACRTKDGGKAAQPHVARIDAAHTARRAAS